MDQPAPATLTVPDVDIEPLHRRLWRTYVTDVRADANARASVTTATDRKMVIVFVVSALALTLNHFLSDGSLHVSSDRDFNQLTYWAIVMIATYVLPAVLCIKFVFHERVRDYGLSAKGIGANARVYLVLFGIAFPVIVAASFAPAFQERYPFYHPIAGHPLGPYLYLWWVLYWFQFIALEFFFRGFMVHGLEPRLGWAAIFAMVVPYNMLHYGKPMPEALAAIVGGIVLGTLALKTRSIWLGASLHISIAVAMDVFALWHLGRL